MAQLGQPAVLGAKAPRLTAPPRELQSTVDVLDAVADLVDDGVASRAQLADQGEARIEAFHGPRRVWPSRLDRNALLGYSASVPVRQELLRSPQARSGAEQRKHPRHEKSLAVRIFKPARGGKKGVDFQA